MKLRWMYFFFLAVLVLGGCSKRTSDSIIDGTNTKPTLYSLVEQKEALEKMPNVYSFAFSNHQKDDGTYVIPGLIATETLKMGTSDATPTVSDSMDPQGVTIADDYLLISSYSQNKQQHSVIYVLNKRTHDYIKTVVLDSNPHVGGITYDAINKKIWVANDLEHGKEARISSISLHTMESYQFYPKKKPIVYDQTLYLTDLHRASFLSYHQNALFVGDFSNHKEGKLHKFSIDEVGSIKKFAERKISLTDEHAEDENIPKKIQGVTFYKDSILFSQSYGESNSAILIMKDTKDHFSLHKDQIKKIEMPPYLEQISVDGGSLYTVFESATKRFREKANVLKVDRVLQLDLNQLITK